MSEDRKRKLLGKLVSLDTVTTGELATLFHVSSRTIRNDIKEINEDLAKRNLMIHLQPGKGVYLKIEDREKVKKLLHNQQKEEGITTQKQRMEFIISKLLFVKDYVTVTSICNKLYVSESQLLLDIRKANKLLIGYHLEIITKARKGIWLKGLEKDKRRYLVDGINTFEQHENSCFLSSYMKHRMSIILENIFQTCDYSINEAMFDYLLLHIMISLYRFQQGFSIRMKKEMCIELSKEKEYAVAIQISDYISNEFQCMLNEEEIMYLTLQLLSKKKQKQLNALDGNMEQMIQSILKMIQKKFAIDFQDDEELKQSLYLHMLPMMNRVRYDLKLKNPLISEIKINYPLTYDLAVEVALMLKQRFDFKLAEDEIAYLSIHFNLALERYKRKIKKYNIILLLPEDTTMSELLKYKFMEKFHDYVKMIQTISPRKLEEYDLNDIDLMIGTQKPEMKLRADFIQISDFLNEEDNKKIQEFFDHCKNDLALVDCISSKLFFTDIKADTKTEAIQRICSRLEQVIHTPKGLYDSIMEREMLLTTELGNMTAFPHPLSPIVETTFMAVVLLEKPILWDEHMVQIIFLCAIAEGNEKSLDAFYAAFVDIVKDEMKIAQLLMKKDFETLLRMVKHER